MSEACFLIFFFLTLLYANVERKHDQMFLSKLSISNRTLNYLHYQSFHNHRP